MSRTAHRHRHVASSSLFQTRANRAALDTFGRILVLIPSCALGRTRVHHAFFSQVPSHRRSKFHAFIPIPMKRSQRYLLVATALVVVCLLIFSQRLRQTDDSDTPLPTAADVSSPSSQAPTKPKITVIVIWSIHDSKAPVYLPYFFQSVEANPDVDLLFVAVDRAGVGCKSHSSSPNVQELCLTENQCASHLFLLVWQVLN